jgi:hypothetical protein
MPFQPGQSGNPAGRPRGARSKTTMIVEELLAGNAEEITGKLIDQAQAGNPGSMALLARSLLPQRKGAPIFIDLPQLEEASDGPAAIAAIYAAVCAGEVSLAEGSALIRMVEAFVRVTQKTGSAERRPELEKAAEVAAAKPPAPPAPHSELVIPGAIDSGAPRTAASAANFMVRAPASAGMTTLRQQVLSSTSPLSQKAPRQAAVQQPAIVSHCIPARGSPAPTDGSRAAA